MKKRIWGLFCALFLAAAGAVLPVLPGDARSGAIWQEEDYFPPAPEADIALYATAAVLMDADSGRILFEKNAETPMAMASTTKIMTCIIVLENADLDETLEVSAYAASMPKVKLYIQKGEQYTVRDLLYSLMLESHNDSAVALAEHVGRKYLTGEAAGRSVAEYTAQESGQAVAAFARLMNEKARELGCQNTWFITPNGLDAVQEYTMEDGSVVQKEHCTTAAELARIMSYCILESPQKESFLKITRTESYGFGANGRSFSCVNHNAFLNMMEGALSGKTGFTNKAGYCYVGSLVRDDRTFVVALLACGWPNNKNYKWNDTRELMQYGIDHFFYRSFSEEGIAFDEEVLKAIPVGEGQTRKIGQKAYTGLRIVEKDRQGDREWEEGLLLRDDEEVRVRYSVKKSLTAPVERGTQVGTIDYMVGDTVYKQDAIVTADTVERIDLEWCMRQILNCFFLPKTP